MKRRDFLKGMSAAVAAIVATGFDNIVFAKEKPATINPDITIGQPEEEGVRSCSSCKECMVQLSTGAPYKTHMFCQGSYFFQPVDGDEAETCLYYRSCDEGL